MRSPFFWCSLLVSLISPLVVSAQIVEPTDTITPTSTVVEVATTSEPLILQMGDGRFYNPQSGLTAPTREDLLSILGLQTALQQQNQTEASNTTGAATPAVSLPLKDAIARGRAILEQLIADQLAKQTKPVIVNSDTGWRSVTLAVWDKNTDQISTVDVLKDGIQIKLDDENADLWPISVKTANGLNSEFVFKRDASKIVVAVRYPILNPVRINGKKRFEEQDVVYTPYSEVLHTPEMVQAGKQIVEQWIKDAFTSLRQTGLHSRAVPGQLAVDVVDPGLIKSILTIEHSDNNALARNPGNQLERFFVTVAANEKSAYAYSKSSSGALGLGQFMPKTYALLAKDPNTHLIQDFEQGARNPQNVIEAQVVYLDRVLAEFPAEVQAEQSVDRERVNEYLAAAYNGGAVRVRRAVAAWGDGWAEPGSKITARLRDRHRELRLSFPGIKSKIAAEEDPTKRKALKEKLAAMQKEYAENEDQQDLVKTAGLKLETAIYVEKYRKVIALVGDSNLGLAMNAQPVPKSEG